MTARLKIFQGVEDAGEDGFDEVSEAVQDAAVLEEVLRYVKKSGMEKVTNNHTQ